MSCNVCDGDSKYYVGDIGTDLVVDTCEPITTATTTDLRIMKPDGNLFTWTGAVYDTTKIKYTVIAGDFDQAGTYRLQAYVVMPGWTGRGDTVFFKVRDLFA
jgi:hypothetical protein